MSRTYKIYRHTTPSGGVYIGQTGTKYVSNRWGRQGNNYRSCPAFWNAIQKYGWDNIKHEILFEGLTKTEADEIEIKLISEAKGGICYNIDSGGYHYGGRPSWNAGKKLGPHKPETIEKIKAQAGWKHRDESRRQMSASHMGLKQTDEHKQHISAALIGKPKSSEHRQHIRDNHWSKNASAGELKKIGKATRGKTVINNGKVNMWVTPDKLDEYLANGFARGMMPQNRRPRQFINKDGQTKNVLLEELEYYMNLGWQKGRPKRNKGK